MTVYLKKQFLKSAAFFCFFLLFNSSIKSQSTLNQSDPFYYLQNVENRSSISLDGRWDIIVDPLETGFYSYRFQERKDGFFINQQMKEPDELVEYNFEKGPKLSVPGDWNTQSEKLYYYENTVWYKKDFTLNKKQGKRYFIHFGAVNYQAIVYVNKKKVGVHEGGYTSFDFDVTDFVTNDKNLVVVKVENKRKADRIPTLNIDWWNYGGITRSVSIIETNETFIYDYSFITNNKNGEIVNGWVQLNGINSANKEVTITIPEITLLQKTKTDKTGKATFSFQKNLTLWSPENPKLYEVKLKYDEDEITDKIGFRTIAVNGNDILLNGKSIFLRGISIHEEAPFKSGRVTNADECRVLLNWAKEMGCNFIRLAHYPHSSAMIKIAEEMGLLVWSEIPVYWTVQFENPAVLQLAYNQLDEMITRDKNRANIILWSVANETPNNENRVTFLTKLIAHARNADNSRLITAALDTQTEEDGFKTIKDPLGQYLDVIGVNSYCGWYGGKPNDCKNMRWKNTYTKPMIMSEMGGGALQGLHGKENERWTEEYQDAVYKNNLEMLTHIPFLRGVSPWILTDFLSPRRPLPEIQNDYNRKGLISNRGIKKKSFYTLQNFYEKIVLGEIKF